MKTFIAALILFFSVCGLVLGASFAVREKASALLSIASALPSSAEAFKDAEVKKEADALCEMWQRDLEFFSHTVCSDALYAAEEALYSLRASAEAGSAEGFFTARMKFISAAERMARLWG